MRGKIALLIYNEAGSFTRRKVFSKKTLKITAVAGIGLAITLSFILFDYAGLKYSNLEYNNLKTEIHTLKADIQDRDTQIESFYARIGALQTKLLKLKELEKEIRSRIGISPKTKKVGALGVGGTFSPGMEDTIWNSEFYNQYLYNLDKEVSQLDRDVNDQSQELQTLWETLRNQIITGQSTPSLRPVDGGYISSGFGFRQSPFSFKREFHSGVDFAVDKGTPVHATANGVVVSIGNIGGLGKAVIIDHGKGITTRYAHLSSYNVEEGQKIERGEIVGKVGSTGRSTGPHLHYEVRINDKPVNGEKYMSEYLAKNNPS
ncbi:MAG: M23 family metallopeptidase [Desulfobacteraceae bacterium]|nr:M23 family metallopeptidase [Desulfobacteraceae bacterium]